MCYYGCNRTAKPITLHEWHLAHLWRHDVLLARGRVAPRLAHLWRHGRKGILQLDQELTVNGTSKGAFTQLTLTLDLFLGGHRDFDEVARNADVTESFRGCIQKVVSGFFLLVYNTSG